MTNAPISRLHKDDNVVVALSNLNPETMIEEGVSASEAIMAGHKVATRQVAQAEETQHKVKYGYETE